MSEPPAFIPPRSNGNVPAFLRGEASKPIYRAAGGDYFGYTSSPFGIQAASSSQHGVKSLSPAPLQFPAQAAVDPYDNWGVPVQPHPEEAGHSRAQQKAKALDLDFGGLSLSTTKVSPATFAPSNYVESDSDDEVGEYDKATLGLAQLPSFSFKPKTSSLSEVLQQFASILDVQQTEFPLDYESMPNLNKIRGVVSGKGERCIFSIQLVQQDSAVVAEVQRREGSQTLFSKLMKDLSNSLDKHSFFSEVSQTGPFASFGGSLSPAVAVEMECLDDETILQLIEMCSSDFQDVTREALKTITPLSMAKSAQMKIHSATVTAPGQTNPLTRMLTQALQSTDQDICWYAACLTANLSETDFCKEVVSLSPLLFSLLSRQPSMAILDTQRQAQRALDLVTQNHSELFMGSFKPEEISKYLDILAGRLSTQ